jgi:hypothetical protein
MSESRFDDPNQQPSWEADIEVWKYIDNEDRDPRLIAVQQLWVFLEEHKREKAGGDSRMAGEALRMAKEHYEAITAKHPYLPPDLRTRLSDLKRDLDECSATGTPSLGSERWG